MSITTHSFIEKYCIFTVQDIRYDLFDLFLFDLILYVPLTICQLNRDGVFLG